MDLGATTGIGAPSFLELSKARKGYGLPGVFAFDSGETHDIIRDVDSGMVPDLGIVNAQPDQLLRIQDDYNPIGREDAKLERPEVNPEDLILKPPVILSEAIRTNDNSQ